MPKQGREKHPKRNLREAKEKTPQKSEESEYPAMDPDEYNRLLQNAVEYAQAKLEQKHEEHIKALEADREAQIKVVEDRLTKKFDDEVLASEAAAAALTRKPQAEYKELLKNQEVQTQQQKIQR